MEGWCGHPPPSSVRTFCLLVYVALNSLAVTINVMQASRPTAAEDNPAAVMIHQHNGEKKLRPCTLVLALSSLLLPAPVTHAYCTKRHLLTACWQMSINTDFKRSVQLWHWDTTIRTYTLHATHLVNHLKSHPTHGDHACTCLHPVRLCVGSTAWSEIIDFVSEDIMADNLIPVLTDEPLSSKKLIGRCHSH